MELGPDEHPACAGADPTIFDAPATPKDYRPAVEKARENYCLRCPIQKKCLEYGKPYEGIWGGELNVYTNKAPKIVGPNINYISFAAPLSPLPPYRSSTAG